MVVSLSSHNVIQYLRSSGLCSSEDGASDDSELPESSKNLNLLVMADNRKLLVKQELRTNNDGKESFSMSGYFTNCLSNFQSLVILERSLHQCCTLMKKTRS